MVLDDLSLPNLQLLNLDFSNNGNNQFQISNIKKINQSKNTTRKITKIDQMWNKQLRKTWE